MKITFKHFLALIFFTAWSALSAMEALAVFTLTASPRRGGQSIRFDESEPGKNLRNEEVTLTVTTDRGVRYRILQTMYQPLMNEFGNTIPQNAFIAFSPSTVVGTLFTQLETPVTMGQAQIYTSDTSGTQESFVLVFNARIPEDQPGGVYRTSLTFTAEPVTPTAGASPSLVTLDVRLELHPTFHVKIQNDRGGRDLDLGRISKERLAASGSIEIKIDSNIGTTYRVVQEMAEPLSSVEGSTIDENACHFSVQTALGGGAVNTAPQETLKLGPQILYTSTDNGRGETLHLDFSITPDVRQKAGVYSGMLHYKIESSSPLVLPEILSVPVRLEIDPIFFLNVKLTEPDGIHFGTFRGGRDKENKQVVLDIQSNLGKPYQVSQVVSRKLTNENGVAIPDDKFLFSVSGLKRGSAAVSVPTPVKDGVSLLFTSDSDGSPEEAEVNYELTIPPEATKGSYSSEIKYSVTSL